MTGAQEPAAGAGRLRAGHADREQAIETLKDAFVHGRLARDELDARAGLALTARTRSELAALTADIAPAPVAARTRPARAAVPVRPPAPVRRRPLARATARAGCLLIIAAVAVWLASLADTDGAPGPIPASLGFPLLLVAVSAIFVAGGILVHGVGAAVEQRQSRRQAAAVPAPGTAAPRQ